MGVPAEHQVQIHAVQQRRPLGVDAALDIEPLAVVAHGFGAEGNVAQRHAGCNALGEIFLLRAGRDLAQKRRLAQAHVVAVHQTAVFRVAVVLVLAAVQHDAPQRAQPEGEPGRAAAVADELDKLRGQFAPIVVIAPGEHHRDRAAGQRAGDLKDGADVLQSLALRWNIAAQQ